MDWRGIFWQIFHRTHNFILHFYNLTLFFTIFCPINLRMNGWLFCIGLITSVRCFCIYIVENVSLIVAVTRHITIFLFIVIEIQKRGVSASHLFWIIIFFPCTKLITSIFILRNQLLNTKHFHNGLFAISICHQREIKKGFQEK